MQPNTREMLRQWASLWHRLRHRAGRRGQTLVEYGLILALIAMVAIGVLTTLGQQTKTFYSSVNSQLTRAGS